MQEMLGIFSRLQAFSLSLVETNRYYMELKEKINRAYDTWRGGREEFERLMKEFYNLGKYGPEGKNLEPFLPGDWICPKKGTGTAYRVQSVDERYYYLEPASSVFESTLYSFRKLDIDVVKLKYRKWSLDTCRPGDLIVCREHNLPFMGLFRGLGNRPDGQTGLQLYCYLCEGHQDFYEEPESEIEYIHATDNFTPATQREADTFFTILKKKGFVWNPKTLVLSKVPALKFKEGDVIEKGSKRALVKYYCETDQEYRLVGNNCYCLPVQEQDRWHKVEKVDPIELACFWLEDTFSCSNCSSGRGESTEWYCSFDSEEEMLTEFKDFMKTYTK